MTIESYLYRPFDTSIVLEEGVVPDFDDTGAEIGQWVPDTRLQAIGDAWNGDKKPWRKEAVQDDWPELAKAITDALIEEKDE